MPNEHPSKTVHIENARLLFRNLAGREREFNSEGDRNFSVIIPKDMALKMKADGWRIKQLKPREEGEEGDYHLKVTVNLKSSNPPLVKIKTSRGTSVLTEKTLAIADAVEIESADVMINGWWSDMAGGGYGGFLRKLGITVVEDAFDLNYGGAWEDAEQQTPENEDDKELVDVSN